MDWRPAASPGAWIGIALAGGLSAGVVALAAAAAVAWPGAAAAVLIWAAVGVAPAAALVAYRAWGRLNLRYGVGRDGVIVRWAAQRQVIPIDNITHVLNGRPYASPLKGLRWPGHEVGRTHIAVGDDGSDLRPALVYATVPPEGQLVIVTPSLAYAISPAERAAFVEEFRVRRRLGAVQLLEQHTEMAAWLRLSVLADPVALRLGLATVLVAILTVTWLTWHYADLPAEVALRYRYSAEAGRMVIASTQARWATWLSVAIGGVVLGANAVLAALLHRRAALAARLLVLGALLVQVVIAVSLLKLA